MSEPKVLKILNDVSTEETSQAIKTVVEDIQTDVGDGAGTDLITRVTNLETKIDALAENNSSGDIESSLSSIVNMLSVDCNKVVADDAVLVTLNTTEKSVSARESGDTNYMSIGSFHTMLPGTVRFSIQAKVKLYRHSTESASIQVTDSSGAIVFSDYHSMTNGAAYTEFTGDVSVTAENQYTIQIGINGDGGYTNTVYSNMTKIKGRYTRDSVEYIYSV